jgi:HPt (histidine-containing phosphotransfer) domain-containing protein
MLLQFIVQQRGAAYELRSAIFSEDLEKAKRICHNLKGVSANLGAYKVAGQTTDLGNAIKNRDASKIEDHLAQLDGSLNHLFHALSQLREPETIPHPIVPMTSSEFNEKISETISLLESDLQTAMRNIDGLMNFSSDSSYRVQVKRVQEAAQAFDTDQVSKLLLELVERAS